MQENSQLDIAEYVFGLISSIGVDPTSEELAEKLDSLHRLYIIEKLESRYGIDLSQLLANQILWRRSEAIASEVYEKVSERDLYEH
jgi:acyl carrier protein